MVEASSNSDWAGGPYGDGTPYPEAPRLIAVDGRIYRLTAHGDVYVRFDRPSAYRTTIERRIAHGGATHRKVNEAYADAIGLGRAPDFTHFGKSIADASNRAA